MRDIAICKRWLEKSWSVVVDLDDTTEPTLPEIHWAATIYLKLQNPSGFTRFINAAKRINSRDPNWPDNFTVLCRICGLCRLPGNPV